MNAARRDLGPWPIRVAWLALALVAGPAIGDLLDGRSRPVGWVAGALVAGAWSAGVLATLVPHPIGLTALRVLAPAALGLALVAALGGDASTASGAAAVAGAVVAWAAVAAGVTTDAFVDGASYGAERRFGLRVPASLFLGPLPLAWAVVVAGCSAGPLLVAEGVWLLGLVVVALGVPAAVVAARALHGLSLRCVVFVPNGFVLLDRTTLGQPVLFPRAAVAKVGPAEAGTDAVDLTAGALGLVVEVRLAEQVTVARRRGRQGSDEVTLDAFLISPVRPGVLLEAARGHHLAVG